MRRADIVAGLFLFAVGVLTLVLVIPAEISGHSDYGLAPDFFPRLLIGLFILLAALLVLHRMLARRRVAEERESQEAPMKRADWIFITGTSVFFIFVYFVMTYLGFIVAGIFTIAAVATVMGSLRSNPFRLALISLIAPIVIFYAFKELFFVFLPS